MGDATSIFDNALSGDFEKDVPKALQDDTLQRIVEVAWGYSADGEISIDDMEQINALNIEFTGSITIEGQEHSFHIKDGNNYGTEVLSWNAGAEIRRETSDPLVLIPHSASVRDAVTYGRAEAFLESWEKDKSGTGEHGETLSKLPGAQAYDSFFAPGTGAVGHYRDMAAKFEYQIGYESDALLVRRTLISSIFKILPLVSKDTSALNDADPAELLASWAELKDAESEIGSMIQTEMRTMTDRMAQDLKLEPTLSELDALSELGVIPARRKAEIALRGHLWSRMISFDPIEGFDRNDLPENPVAQLFKALDAELVGSTKVNPVTEITNLTEQLISKISRGSNDTIDDAWFEAAARVGYQLVVNSVERKAEPEECMEP